MNGLLRIRQRYQQLAQSDKKTGGLSPATT